MIDGQEINGTVLNNQTSKGSNSNGGYIIYNLTYSNNTNNSNDTYFRIFNNSTNVDTGNQLRATNFTVSKFFYVNDSFDRRSQYLANYSNTTSKQNFSVEALYVYTDFKDNHPTYTRELISKTVNPFESTEGNVTIADRDEFITRDETNKNSTYLLSVVGTITTFNNLTFVNYTVARFNETDNNINSHNESYNVTGFGNSTSEYYSANGTYINYTTQTILNVTVNLANNTNQTVIEKLVTKTWDLTDNNATGQSYTYNYTQANETGFNNQNNSVTTTLYTIETGVDPTVTRRRILMEKKTIKQHFQGTTTIVTGGNFIWVSCFTGFGEASLININSIVDNQPTIDNCITRINAERPNFTVEKLRVAVNTFQAQNPGSL